MRYELTGQKFGILTVISRSRSGYWECRCDCGNTTEAMGHALAHGKRTSCGCLKNKRLGDLNRTHGMSRDKNMKRTKEYSAWQGIIARCYKPKIVGYKNYGGRGIKVCERWLEDFSAFLEDMGLSPSPKHSIDRINYNGDYEPSNCRWATSREQSLNKRTNRVIEHDGRSMTLKEWSEFTGMKYTLLKSRLDVQCMTFQEALTYPNQKELRYEHDGKSMTIKEWSGITGLPCQVINNRINRLEWSVKDALTTPLGGKRP